MRATVFPASIFRFRLLKIISLGLDGLPSISVSTLIPSWSSGAISLFLSKMAKTDMTARLPFTKSEVMLPASAMVLPVLINMKNA
ncbi:hypothetical protein RHGRI_034261 [Rhododendron griersonianum]|uniref:Uncharacterized protein n=1 Tax=Rhododendron griersonianum TaxID=479676 RepID=A0AAV6HZZ1_9ERIC|nr:hypothetical protein RHGRI_034261 [Rhododendron griersonianum]